MSYVIGTNSPKTLGRWYEKNEGLVYTVDVDLTSLAGNNVQLILGVENLGNASQASGIWFVPSVRQAAALSHGNRHTTGAYAHAHGDPARAIGDAHLPAGPGNANQPGDAVSEPLPINSLQSRKKGLASVSRQSFFILLIL